MHLFINDLRKFEKCVRNFSNDLIINQNYFNQSMSQSSRDNNKYELYSVINHIGNDYETIGDDSGHYTG